MKKSYHKVICILLLLTIFQTYIFSGNSIAYAETYNCNNLPLNSGIVYDCGSPLNAGAIAGHYEGGTVCSPYSGNICNICGQNYASCPHGAGSTFGGTICAPSIRICNICGGNYATCPHGGGSTYGGTVCSPSPVNICNICGASYASCSHGAGSTYGGTVCAPSIRICNICRGNYASCPHGAGSTYGGIVCSPSISICNICGGNNATCSHGAGSTYGGRVCSPYYVNICNICGRDNTSCPHSIGTTYGGTVCTPYPGSICNICSQNYASCPHGSGTTYGGTWVPSTPNTYHVHNSCSYHYTTHTHTAECILITYDKFTRNITSIPVDQLRTDAITTSNKEYNSMSWSDKLINAEYLGTIYALATATVAGGGIVGEKDASDLLKYYLYNQGTPVVVDFYRMTNEWDYANTNKSNDLTQFRRAAEVLARPGETVSFMNNAEYQNGKPTGYGNWVHAINSYDSSLKGSVTLTSANTYSATYTYFMNDFYNYDKLIYDMGKLPVSPHELWYLHYAGMSLNYQVSGSFSSSITWTKGE